jgi:hypothetical protein
VVPRGVSPELSAVNWKAPWFGPVAADGRGLSGAPDPREALTRAARLRNVCTATGQPVRFVDPDAAGDVAYEAHIGRTGEVPTRSNLHDVFNALVWLAFPRAKARLNALQSRAIATEGVGARRGPLRDAATLLDENGVLLVTRRLDLVEALRQHAWHGLFVAERSAWAADIRPVVFGHALMEKLTAPYKGIAAHALPVVLAPDAPLSDVDAWVAAALDKTLTPRGLLPIPVLGIPGWTANDDVAYYDDPAVFRPMRSPRARRVTTAPAGRQSQRYGDQR